MKTVKLVDLDLGSLFEYGGIKWAVLDYNRSCTTSVEDAGFVLCISANVVADRAFDDGGNIDFKKSTLRAWLNGEFIDHLVDHGADMSEFKGLHLDLTSYDGLDDYGTDIVTIGLIPCDMYLDYRRYMPCAAERWWTCTPWSNKTRADKDRNYVRCVNSSGGLTIIVACDVRSGVRPICSLHYDTLVHPSSD